MPVNARRKFWGQLPEFDKEFAAAALERFKSHSSALIESKRHTRMQRAWLMYYSRARDGGWDDTEIQAVGPNGETTLVKPNEFRNLLQHQLNLVTQTPPAFDCVAVNNDSESFAQAQLGNGILDYYMRVHHLDDLRVERAEVSLLLGESFLHARWDPGAGDEAAVEYEDELDENGQPILEDVPPEELAAQQAMPGADASGNPTSEGGPALAGDVEEGRHAQPEASPAETVTEPALPPGKRKKQKAKIVYKGEFVFRVNTPYDVAYDPVAPDKNRPRWKIIREPANRYDLAAQYPEHAERILDAEPYSKCLADEVKYLKSEYQHDDYVAVYFVYLEKAAAIPDGREALLLDDETVLEDMPLSEDRIPDFRVAASNVIFQTGGYTNNFDLMPLQEVLAAQWSTVLSNHTAFGKQWVATPKGSHVKPQHISRGLGVIEYDAVQGNPPPQALSLLASQEEHLTFLDIIRQAMERFAVVPPPMRGESTKGDSGAKEALIHSAAQQYASGFHRSLSRSDEDLGTHILMSLRSHATAPRVATIVGRFNSYASAEFTGDGLQKISRVTVRSNNAMRDTPQGREMLADKLMTFPDGIVTAEQYIMFLDTGRVDPMYETTRAELMLIRRENEALRDPNGEEVIVDRDDLHALHYQEHKCQKADPAVRKNPALLKKIDDHMQEHFRKLMPAMPDPMTGAPGPNPDFAGPALLMTGQKPLPAPQPAQKPPGMDEGDAGDGPPQKAGPKRPDPQGGPGPQPGDGRGGKPGMPKAPMNPATGQRANIPAVQPPPVTQG